MTSSGFVQRLNLPPGLAVIVRFALAGLVNTAVGLSVTLALDIGLHVSPALSNAAGYAVGIMVSWLLQRRFVFRSEQSGWATKARWITVIAISFGVNQGVLYLAHQVLGEAPLARTAAQIVAMGTYTVVQFILMRLWVFRAAPKPAAP